MCGRITQSSPPDQLGLRIVFGTPDDRRVREAPPRYNGAPGQEHLIIRQEPKTGKRTLDRLWWGLIPSWAKDPMGGQRPINAKAETVASLPSFRDAYKRRRCLLPIDNFFEWGAVKGEPKQPYALAMQDGRPFALAGIWESWRTPGTDEIVRTFCIITCPANALMSTIHDRMPVILARGDYGRLLSTLEPDPRDLLVPYHAELMRMWPISPRVNAVANDDVGILDRED